MLQSLGRMQELSLTSVIDILFVALIIYGFLKLLKWTHAMPALLGVAAVVLAVYWAHFKGLNTIDWLVTAVAPLTIFALIVVFAAEIRHSLVRLGLSFSMTRIVQKGKIAAAACFLPLATDPQLSAQMGTRHRAGIGVTEETDAIAVIVSEETGGISIASHGSIERDLTPEHLRERISELLRRYIPRTTLPTAATDRDLVITEPKLSSAMRDESAADGAEL